MRGQAGTITKLETTTKKERAPLLYDLTSLQRDANTRYGFSARRTLAAAQRLYEEHKALTYPRTNSRFLSTDMIAEIKPTVEGVGKNPVYAAPAKYVAQLDVLPLGRVINDAKVTDHHAIIPTRSEHRTDKMCDDDKKVYDMVARRFLAVFHPDAVWENTRLETTVAEHVFRTRGRVLLEPGWRAAYGEVAAGSGEARETDDDEVDQTLPKLAADEPVDTREVASAEKETKPPRRYSDASLLGAMEAAGKELDDEALREQMKDSGIGTPATRAAIIERLIDVGYIERDARSLVCTEKGLNVIRLLDGHPLTSPGLTGDWEHRLLEDRARRREARALHGGHRRVRPRHGRRARREAQGGAHPARQPRARARSAATTSSRTARASRAGRARIPGCGFVIWKSKAGKTLPAAGRPRADRDRQDREGGDRLQGPLRPLVPRAAGARADARGQVARRVRRAVGARGRQAARAGGRARPGDEETPATDAAASAEAA